MTLTTNLSYESLNLSICDYFDFSYPLKVGQVVVYSIALLLSLVGNAFVILVVSKRQELKKTTNFFIVNMAASDLLFSVTAIPVHLQGVVAGSWHFAIGGTVGLVLCKLQRFVEMVPFVVSVQSLVWIAADRFVAVVFPMKAQLISSTSRRVAIASTWLMAMVVNSYDLYVDGAFDDNGKVICLTNYAITDNAYAIYARVYSAVFQIAPLLAMTILYSIIAATLRRQDKVLQCASQVRQRDQTKQRAIKMAFSIMVAFYICYLPPLVAAVITQYHLAAPCSVLKVLWLVGISTVYLSSLTNPIICFGFVRSYRNGLKEVVDSCWSKQGRSRKTESDDQGAITLGKLRSNQAMEDNLAFSGD